VQQDCLVRSALPAAWYLQFLVTAAPASAPPYLAQVCALHKQLRLGLLVGAPVAGPCVQVGQQREQALHHLGGLGGGQGGSQGTGRKGESGGVGGRGKRESQRGATKGT
jgi:hypothetical protein